MQNTPSGPQVAKRVYTIPEFGERYGPGKTRTYQEINAGRLIASKVGRSTLITHDNAEDRLANLENLLPAGEAAQEATT